MNAKVDVASKSLGSSSKLYVLAFALVLAFGLFLPSRAAAQEQGTNGQVGQIDGFNNNGFSLQIAPAGTVPLCTVAAGSNYGLITVGDQYATTIDRAKAMLAIAIAAKLSGTLVWVYARPNPGGYGCDVRVITF